MRTKVRKWGHALGIIVPAEVVRAQSLREGDSVRVEFRGRVPTVGELGGTFRLRTDLRMLMREMERDGD